VGVFTKKPLGVLDNIYRFVGGQSGPNSFAEEMAIQPVHDVSREAELGTAQSPERGYFLRGFDHAHVGTGSIFNQQGCYDRTFDSLDAEDVDLWIIDVLCQNNDASDFASAGGGLEYPILPGVFNAQIKSLREFVDADQVPALISSGLVPVPPVDDFAVLPIYCPHGSEFVQRTTSDNAGTVTISVYFLFWAGARRTSPPGLY